MGIGFLQTHSLRHYHSW